MSTALLSAKYSRDFEREADAFAADLLRRNGISPGYLADILESLDRASRSRHRAGPVDPEYLSTHRRADPVASRTMNEFGTSALVTADFKRPSPKVT